MQVWDVQERTKLASWKGPSMLQGASWLPNGRHVLTTSYAAKAAEVWDVSTGERVAAFETDVPLYACAISPDGRGAVVGDSEGRVIFLRVRGM
jgi:WD40 repeat protein